MDKKLLLGVVAVVGIAIIAFAVARRRKDTFSAGDKFSVVLAPYNGKYKDDPKIKAFIKNFDGIVNKAKNNVKSKHPELPEPPMVITLTLDDSFDADPFLSPGAAMTCAPRKFEHGKGNCNSYNVSLGSKNIVEGFKGRTGPEQYLTHEFTHVFMYYSIPGMNQKPGWFTEGWAIETAGQKELVKKIQKNVEPDPDNKYVHWNEGIPLDRYSKYVDDFDRHYNNSSSSSSS